MSKQSEKRWFLPLGCLCRTTRKVGGFEVRTAAGQSLELGDISARVVEGVLVCTVCDYQYQITYVRVPTETGSLVGICLEDA